MNLKTAVLIMVILVGVLVAAQGLATWQAAVARRAAMCPERTICNQAAAIAHSLELLPPNITPTASVARLVTLGQALQWQGLPIADPGDPGLEKAVWVVGVLAPGLQVANHDFPTEANHAIGGMWFVWIASGGGLDSRGGLAFPERRGPGYLRYSDIEALVSQDLPIELPTGFPTASPGPWPTSELWP